MPFLASRPFARAAAILALQALLWGGLTLAFAALIQAAGWAPWHEALSVSAVNWLPWAVIAPVVFWLARKFPFERGHLLRSVPLHAVACAACVLATIWASAFFAPRRPPARPPFENRGAPREPGPRPVAETAPTETDPNAAAPERAAGETAAPPSTVERRSGPPGPHSGGERGSGPRRNWDNPERRERGGGGGPGGPGGGFRGGPRPPPEGAAGTLRHWAWLGSFWPPFNSVLLRANSSVAVYLIIACLAHAVGFYRRAQERERQALSLAAGLNRAKLDALRLQLQPHFLFNTLNAISVLVHRNPHAADELIADLSELLRQSLQSSDHEVPLARELELLNAYLGIEQTRLGERLRIVRDVDPAALDALVPTLVLQPLAENAVRHGIEPRLGPGTLTISARRDGERIALVVADDGVGLKKDAPRKATRAGIGLANTEERLRALHGSDARLEMTTPPEGGVRIEITLPRRTTSSTGLQPVPENPETSSAG